MSEIDRIQQNMDEAKNERDVQEAFLKQQREEQAALLEKQAQAVQQQAQKIFEENARQAYIARMENQRDVPQVLAAQGAAGGGTESTGRALDSAYNRQLEESRLKQALENASSNNDYQNRLKELDLALKENLYRNNVTYDDIARNYRLEFDRAQDAQRKYEESQRQMKEQEAKNDLRYEEQMALNKQQPQGSNSTQTVRLDIGTWNLRKGPGTNYQSAGAINNNGANQAVEVVEVLPNGWRRLSNNYFIGPGAFTGRYRW